jgi:hypothetical protein
MTLMDSLSSKVTTSLFDAREKIAQARRELWWFIETYTDEDEDTVARAMSIQDDLLYPALRQIEVELGLREKTGTL